MTTYQVIDVLSNKFPCEGPRDVPVVLDFSTAPTFDIDLKALQLRNLISNIQSIFVDNADNTATLVLTMTGSTQRIIIPAFGQAYIALLLGQAEFTVATSSTALVKVHPLNFPVTNCVWTVPAGGTAGSTVNVANFPANQIVTLSTATSYAFTPIYPGYTISVTNASSSITILSLVGQNLRVTNTGTKVVAFRWGSGAQTAVATDLTLMPNQSILVNGGVADTLAAICPNGTDTSTLQISRGTGGLTA